MDERREDQCEWCGNKGATKRCGKCRKVCYCGRECQVMDWKVKHKALCGKDIPSEDPYTLICKEMDAFVTNVANPLESRHSVEDWRTEFSRANYKRCVELFDCVVTDGANAEAVERIKQIGRDIDSEGGLDAMQACFYILLQFMTPENVELKRAVRDIQIYWDGVGRWEN
jgi:hypothetical protein